MVEPMVHESEVAMEARIAVERRMTVKATAAVEAVAVEAAAAVNPPPRPLAASAKAGAPASVDACITGSFKGPGAYRIAGPAKSRENAATTTR